MFIKKAGGAMTTLAEIKAARTTMYETEWVPEYADLLIRAVEQLGEVAQAELEEGMGRGFDSPVDLDVLGLLDD